MLRTINQTGRRKILANEFKLTMKNTESSYPSFDAEFHLDKSKLLDHAKIFIEAYHRNTLQRFSFGTVSSTRSPENRQLNELDHSGPILFRIRIVDETGGFAKIIAGADHIKAEGENDDEQTSSLLAVTQKPLGHLTWKIETQTGDKPMLCLNNDIPDAIGQISSNPMFQALVLPGALRELLTFYLWDDSEDEFGKRWLEFAEHLFEQAPDEDDALSRLNWVNDVAEYFCKRHDLCEKLVSRMDNADA